MASPSSISLFCSSSDDELIGTALLALLQLW
jgi:hypothetical protein